MDHYRPGDLITITATANGRRVEAFVQMASHDGRRMIVNFDGMIDGWAGTMALFRHESEPEGVWRAIDGLPFIVHPHIIH